MAGPTLDSAHSPAVTTISANATSATCALFEPPDASLILIRFSVQAADSLSAQSVTGVTNTGTPLTWHREVFSNHSGSAPGGAAEVWWAYNPTAQTGPLGTGIQVTATFARPSSSAGDANGGIMAVEVYDGAATSLAGAARNTQVNTTAGAPSASVGTTAPNSLVVGVCLDWSSNQPPVPVTGQTAPTFVNDNTAIAGNWLQNQDASTPAAGTVVPISDTSPVAKTQLVVIEILAATGPPPTVTGVAPSSGPTAGGTSVVITGTNFTGATGVSFGTVAATSFSVDSSTQITAVAPAEVQATVDITVITPAATSATSPSDHYSFIAPVPTITGVSPSGGSTSGNTSVAITGTGFTAALTCKFGGIEANGFNVNSDTSITAFSPAGAAGTVDITVTTAGGTSATSSADHFTYVPGVPTVTAVSPSSGSTAGGTSVGITGTGFTSATAVKFGAVSASFNVNSDTSITALSPAGSAGTVDVTVTNPGGTSATATADHFTYVTPPPAVTGVSPSSGPTTGATSVVITGTSFTGATAVKFGTVNAASFSVDSPTQITVSSPAGSAGAVDITVTTPIGTSATSSADHFTYTSPASPTVTGVSPSSGPTAGGTVVTITGTNFTAVTGVKFGAVSASYQLNSPTSITATAPMHFAGTLDVTVTTSQGTSPTSAADHFTYTAPVPTVTSVSPSSGAEAGETSVAIAGTGFTAASTVKFGTIEANGFNVNSDTSITAVSPAGSGTVDIIVTTAGGASSPSASDQFIYVPPPPAASAFVAPVRPPVLGCSDYRAFVATRGGAMLLAELNYSTLSFTHVLNDVGTCTVTVSSDQDPDCASVLADIEPWEHEIVVFADDDTEPQWAGPLIVPQWDDHALQIQARDLWTWFERRDLPVDRTFTATELADIFAKLMADAYDIDPAPNLTFSRTGDSGVIGDRSYTAAPSTRCADACRQLAQSGVDWTTIGRSVIFGGNPIPAQPLFVLFDPIVDAAQVAKQGLNMASRVTVNGVSSAAGGTVIGTVGADLGDPHGVVQQSSSDTTITSNEAALMQAYQQSKFLNPTPRYLQVNLLPDTPATLAQLIPGVRIDSALRIGLREEVGPFRLQQLTVTVDQTGGVIVQAQLVPLLVPVNVS